MPKPKTLSDEALREIRDLLITKEDVILTGIGKIALVKRKARQQRNPQTGAMMSVPEAWSVKIKPSPKFREELNAF